MVCKSSDKSKYLWLATWPYRIIFLAAEWEMWVSCPQIKTYNKSKRRNWSNSSNRTSNFSFSLELGLMIASTSFPPGFPICWSRDYCQCNPTEFQQPLNVFQINCLPAIPGKPGIPLRFIPNGTVSEQCQCPWVVFTYSLIKVALRSTRNNHDRSDRTNARHQSTLYFFFGLIRFHGYKSRYEGENTKAT